MAHCATTRTTRSRPNCRRSSSVITCPADSDAIRLATWPRSSAMTSKPTGTTPATSVAGTVGTAAGPNPGGEGGAPGAVFSAAANRSRKPEAGPVGA